VDWTDCDSNDSNVYRFKSVQRGLATCCQRPWAAGSVTARRANRHHAGTLKLCPVALLPKASTELPPPISKIASPPNGRLQQLVADSEVSKTSKDTVYYTNTELGDCRWAARVESKLFSDTKLGLPLLSAQGPRWNVLNNSMQYTW